MKLLVTGGAGFIGSNFLELILKNNSIDLQITIVDNLTYSGDLDSLKFISGKKNIEFIKGDVTDPSLIENLMRSKTHVIHFAAETHVTRSLFDSRQFVLTDIVGTQTLLSAIVNNSKTIEKFIHISTSEVYGSAESDFMDESHSLKPLSPYAAAKCGADRLVYSYIKSFNIPGLIVRPFNNYGPRQHLEKVIPRFITAAMSDSDLSIHGDGSAERDWIHVHDTCASLIEILFKDFTKLDLIELNLGTGISTSISSIANIILSHFPDSKSKIVYSRDRPAQVFRHTSSQLKAKEFLSSFEPIQLKEGITQTIDWYKQNRIWWLKRWDARSLEITLPDGSTVFH